MLFERDQFCAYDALGIRDADYPVRGHLYTGHCMLRICEGRVRYPRAASFLRAVADRAAARSAWLACALFLLAGVAVLDDYGMNEDERMQRRTARLTLDYARGRNDELLRYEDRMYGVAVEAPLLWAERALGLQDSRAIYLLRHLLTHLLFLAGGLGAAALAFRLYGRRWLALAALGLFLLHPRLYAHSFFNSKDLPFLSLFMLALLLLHWTFRRDTARAFLLCGVGVGALANVRPMGLLLGAAVLALRTGDFLWAADRAARRRVLRTGGAFAAACALTLYALFPYLWSDPVRRLAESLAYVADYPHLMPQLFRGRYVSSEALPPAYAPVWFAITAPPPALGFGLVGLAALARRAWRRPEALLRHTRLRFEGLLLVCCVLPAWAAILLESTMYNGWRHLYFLYAPFCLLATGGLAALAAAARRFRPRGRLGWPGGLAGAGAAATLGALVALHPHQHLYFNFLVDRATPARLLVRYDLDYWQIAFRRALEFLFAQYPDAPIRVQQQFVEGYVNRELLPAADRQRFVPVNHAGDFYITDRRAPWFGGPVLPPPYAPVIYSEKVYGNPIVEVLAVDLAKAAAAAAPYRAAYRALAAREPVIRDRFDVYLDERAVSWVQAPCRLEDTAPRFLLYVTPVDPQDLPPDRRAAGFDNLNFYFYERGVRVDGACLAVVPRPAYPVRSLTVGQLIPDGGPVLWQADFALPLAPATAHAYRAAYRSLATSAPTRRAPFDVYVTPSTVTFAKAPCAAADAQPHFIAHAAPRNPQDLPGRPFHNLGFAFPARGARFDGICLASVPRPAYPVRSLTVGQWLPVAGDEPALWQAALSLPPAPRTLRAVRAAYRALAADTPAYRASFFDVHVAADAVAFAKRPCAPADTQPRFFLHVVPVRPRDLPPARRAAGFANRDFEFAEQGLHFDDACLARIPLPAWPVARLRVGQFRAGQVASPLWRAEIPLAQ